MHPGSITVIGTTHLRRCGMHFGIRQPDRLSHVYIVGKTGTGKSTLLSSMVLQDIGAGRGTCLIDPHGDAVAAIAESRVARERFDVIYFDAADPACPFGYNPLRLVRRDRIPLAVSGMLEALRMLWPSAWGVRMEHLLRNALYALLETRGSTLTDIHRMLLDRTFRRRVAQSITNEPVARFWLREFDRFSMSYRADGVAAIQNKVGAFLADPALRRILIEREDTLRLRRVMDEGGVLLVNLAKGRLGADSANLLGSLLVTTIGLAAISRADQAEARRRSFHVFIDEFQSFTTQSTADLISELRKYGVSFTLAHQHLHQLTEAVRYAVLGNAGTLISFRVGPEDAGVLARHFAPVFGCPDLGELPNHNIYLRLLIDGVPSSPFSATTLPLSTL